MTRGAIALGRRIALSLLTGYVFLYFGELMFWATPEREGMDPLGLLPAWLMYSVFGYVFLCVVAFFRARGPWAIFLAGAVFGWFEEGIVLQTTYGAGGTPFPLSISFTALAWHALIDVLVGWYLLRKVLSQNRPWRTAGIAALIGVFYALWAMSWWTEPPGPMATLLATGGSGLLALRFGAFTGVSTLLLIVSLWLFSRLAQTPFAPSRVEYSLVVLATLAWFGFVTVPTAPVAAWVMPPLLAVTFWALHRNRRAERLLDAGVSLSAHAPPTSYAALLLVPVVATAIYALAIVTGARWRTNVVVFYATTALGAGLWIAAVVSLLRRPAAFAESRHVLYRIRRLR